MGYPLRVTDWQGRAGEALKAVLNMMMLSVLLLCSATQMARADEPALLFPPMTGSVVDAAQMLDNPTTARLSTMLGEHEQATGERVVVVTLVDLQGTTIEDYGTRLGKAWGMGSKGKGNGALLIVSRDNRKVRIEVGTGLQGRLNEAQSSMIINMLVTPEFREGNFATGIERGAQAMIAALGGHVPDDPDPSPDSTYVGQSGSVLWSVLLLVLAGVALFMAVLAMTNLGRRLRSKADGGRGKLDPSGSRVIRGSGKGFGGGGASGNW